MATHHTPQSLPSFALAFSSSSLNNIHPSNNALPPIQPRISLDRLQRRKDTPSSRDQSRHPSVERNPPSQPNGRKRSREDRSSASNSGSDRQSPRVVRVKEEEEHDMLDATPPPPSQSRLIQPRPSLDIIGASPSSNVGPPPKKRRVSISSAPHRLDTDVRAPSLDPSNSTPISPAVMGFTIGRDDPAAIEQVRSMLTVKQKQKALIEQRRGSVAGLVNTKPSNPIMNEARRGSVAGILTVAPNGDSSPRATGAVRIASGNGANPSEERPLPKPPVSTRNTRRSPITGITTSTSRRVANAPPAPNQNESGSARPPSPSPIAVSSQQTQLTPNQQAPHNLPPPPISFAHRRAEQFGAGKNKPADIVISPREAQSPDQLALSIQSAPPVPHAQGQSVGRFPMTLPRLPAAMGDSQNTQRVTSGKVPPTPTRLTMQRGPTGRSPSDASVPIATTLVPPTPTSLYRPGYIGEKSAFLAPFELFYDALNDSKQLKNWLADQLQKSNSLMQSLKYQQENLDEMVERAVEKRMGRMRDEVTTLHRKVEELEGALYAAKADRRSSTDVLGGAKGKGKYMARNGVPPAPEPPASYTFPPVDPPRRPELLRNVSSPSWAHESDRESRSMQGSERTSPPPPFDAERRLSVSSTRYEPPRPQPMESSHSRGSQGPSRGPPGFTPIGPTVKTSSTPANAKQPRTSQQERPSFHQRRSSDAVGDAPPNSAGADRRNPAIMSPPDDIRRPSTEDG